MNYIYDVLLNFQQELYDFYDWNKEDSIFHIRKIPILKVGTEKLQEIKNYDVDFNEDVLKKLKNKTEFFFIKSVKVLEHACLLSDGVEVIGVRIQDGRCSYSKLLFDEEEDVLDVVIKMEEQEILYNKKNQKKIANFNTRKDLEMKKFIKKEMNKLSKDQDLEKIKYIYFECFNKKENDKNKIIDKLHKEMNFNFGKVKDKLYNLFQLLETVE